MVPDPRPNAALIERFYGALARRDAAAMVACYAPDVRFSDPVFPRLDAAGAAAMWRMLCVRGKDLAVVASGIEADATAGRAHWVATYTYSATRRHVENRIDATFAFRDGLIVRHVDRFDLHRWAQQALGTPGALFGWFPPFQNAIRARAAKALAAWRAAERAPAPGQSQATGAGPADVP
jgi:ketosteroid isomerase-like protein